MRPAGADGFIALYGEPPTRLARAPGRVNLIGEHIDYCGLPVLPIAIDRGISLLYRPRTDAAVRVASELPGLERREFEIAAEIAPYAPGDWGNYPKAAARAVARGYGPRNPGGGGSDDAPAGPSGDHGASGDHDASDLRGIDALVVSDLPPAAGLSSSSALVVACALALLEANGRTLGDDVDPRELARRLAAGERYVGTEGGGMDQAVCLLAEAGHALRIAFDPLRTADVLVPSAWRFVVAHSLERAEKSGAARETYNRRRSECGEALRHLRAARENEGTTRANEASDTGPDGAPPETGPATYPRLLATLGPSTLLSRAADLPAPLDRRFRHVVTEAVRVDAAERALRDGDLEPFGAVLLDGHLSLREDYEVSTPALDRLVEIAVERGAAGARLTGAGLGGCVVAVCAAGREASLLAGLEASFYAERDFAGPLQRHLFPVLPSAAAGLESLFGETGREPLP